LPGDLEEKFEEVTGGGLYPVIGYGPLRREAELTKFSVLTSNIPELTHALDVFKEVVGSDYNLGRFVPSENLQNLVSENPHLFRLKDISVQGTLAPTDVRNAASLFGPSYWPMRAFALVDICGFSVLQPKDQLAHLLSLDNAVRSAIRRCRGICTGLGISPSFSRSSTGDGYYIWHEQPGIPADLGVFALLVAIMTQSEVMRAKGIFSMRLKGSFAIGEVFTFFDRLSPDSGHYAGQNAVGPVTNDLARLIAAARPSQILVQEFDRPGSLGNLTPANLVTRTTGLFTAENRGQCQLTFEPASPSPPLRIQDKHGTFHHCWNLTGVVYNQFSQSEPPAAQRIGLKADPAADFGQYHFKGEV